MDYHIATILNAVASGDMIPKADHKLAVAEAYRKAADSLLECSVWCDSQERTDDGWRNGVTDARKHHMARIRALADTDTDALAEVQALRAELAATQAKLARMVGLVRWAYDTLWELNPSNYDHDEVCKVNAAAVEVILGLAPVIGETHGHSAEWSGGHAKTEQAAKNAILAKARDWLREAGIDG